MNTLMNDQMKKIIDLLNNEEVPTYSSLILSDLLNPNFVEVSGCIIRAKPNESVKAFDANSTCFIDRTGFEAFNSHIHLRDYISEFKYGLFEGIRFFVRLVDVWSHKLKGLFPDYEFHVVISFDNEDSTLRFYRLRNEESPWIDIENLNNYREEAVLVQII